MSHMSMELTYDDMWEFCEMLKPIIGDYHFIRARYPYGDHSILSVGMEKNSDVLGYKYVLITPDKIKEILDHATKF